MITFCFVNTFSKFYHIFKDISWYLGSECCVIFGRKFERPSIPWYVSKNAHWNSFYKTLKAPDPFCLVNVNLIVVLFLFIWLCILRDQKGRRGQSSKCKLDLSEVQYLHMSRFFYHYNQRLWLVTWQNVKLNTLSCLGK